MCPWRTAPSTYRSWSWRSRCVCLWLRRSVCVASVGWREHCLSLLPLRQTLVWLGHDAPKFSSLVLATPTRFDTLPATSALLGSGEGSSLAQRLGAQALSCLAAPPPHVKLTAPCAHTHSPENRQGGAGEQQPAVLVPAADGAATLPTSRCDTSHSSSQRACAPRLLPRSTYYRCSQEGKADYCFIPTRAAALFVRVSHLSADGTVYAHACVRSLAASRRRRRRYDYEPCYDPGPSSTAAAAAARSSSCLGGRPQGCSMRCRQVYFCRPTLSFSASAM